MKRPRAAPPLETTRRRIASQVRDLRRARGWTQAELAARLHLSQNRLSELERGGGSFSAEQLLVILKLFNAPISLFVPDEETDQLATLQNALVRLGALHLQESDHTLPSERLQHVNDVVREALLSRVPRLVAAVAPALARNADQVNLHVIDDHLLETGLDARLPWVVENTIEALSSELTASLPRPWTQTYRRALVVLDAYRVRVSARADRIEFVDVLDVQIRTKKSADEVRALSSRISRRWGVVSGLQPADFAAALRSARVEP